LADLSVIDELRAYLIASGVVQAQDAAPSNVLPAVWIIPINGAAPAPRDGENIAVTLRDTLLAPAASLEAWVIETFVDVIVRSRIEPAGTFLQRQIAGLLHPNDAHGGKKQWTMGALLVEYSTFWRGDQPLPPANPDDPTYDRVQSFRIGCRRKALAGQPTVP
jgi:hypothetical protein